MYQVSNLNEEMLFCTSLSNSILNLDFGFKIETKFFISYDRIKFELYTFEKFSHENKFQFFDLITSNFGKKKLEQIGWSKLFITKTKTSECGHCTIEIEFFKKS